MKSGTGKPDYFRSVTTSHPKARCDRKRGAGFQRLTIKAGERYFHLFCTTESLKNRRDEVIFWADRLARQLCWQIYEMSIRPASSIEATERKHALFENQLATRP